MILDIILIALFLSIIFNIILNRYHMPTIIGYILTGTIIAYSFGFHDVSGNETFFLISELGIAFLMFTIGLEFSFSELKKIKKNVFFYGAMQFFITALVIYIISYFLIGLDYKQSLVIASGLSLSSTAIVLKILKEKNLLDKEFGKKSVGVLLFQDLMVVPILILITILSGSQEGIGFILAETFLGGVALLFILFFIGKYLLDYFFYKIVKTKSNEIFIAAILFIVIGAGSLAHHFHLSYSLGAFLAGLLIAETHYKHQVEADLVPFRDILLGFFFISVGMQINFSVIGDNLLNIIFFLFLFISIKVIIILGILYKSSKKKDALKTALTLFQFGEFGLVIFELAIKNSILDNTIGQTIIIVIIISMVITPFIIKNLDKISDLILKNKFENLEELFTIEKEKNGIIIVGYGNLGKLLSKILDKKNISYTIIESDIDAYKEAMFDEKKVIFGDASKTTTLKTAGIETASNIIISTRSCLKKGLIISKSRELSKTINIITNVDSYEQKKKLNDMNIKKVFVGDEKIAKKIFNNLEI